MRSHLNAPTPAVNAVGAVSERPDDAPAQTPPGSAYEAGYADARKEILDAIVWIAEEFLRGRDTGATRTRRDVYAFIAHLDHRLQNPPRADTVEGGLGI